MVGPGPGGQDAQRGIVRQMLLALAISVAAVIGALAWGVPTQLATRLATLGTSAAILGLWLAAAIARVATIRFASPDTPDERGQRARAILRDTLEQVALALFAQVAVATIVDRGALVLGLHAALFTIGRTLFWAGYAHGARHRAFGFALSFYPGVLMLATVMVTLVTR